MAEQDEHRSAPCDGERSATYSVWLIRRREGGAIDDAAHQYLTETHCLFDAALDGYVCGDGESGLPLAYHYFLPAHDLVVTPAAISYDPEWFYPPLPEPVFEALPDSWNGRPPPCRVTGEELPLLWFLAAGINDGRPFLASWSDGAWHHSGGVCCAPEQAVADCWQLLATLGEVGAMVAARLDAANANRRSRAVRQQILDDMEGSAWQVGIRTGRIQRATVVKPAEQNTSAATEGA